MKNHSHSRIFLLLPVALLFAGCVVHRTVHVHYRPAPSNPLAVLKPMKVALAVTDSCPAAERDQLAQINRVIYVLEGGAVSQVEAAFKRELEEGGHQVFTRDTASADASVKVDLKRVRIGLYVRGSSRFIDTAFVQADVSVSRLGRESQAAHFVATASEQKIDKTTATMEGIFNEAFHNFVHNAILDPRFVEPLKL